MSVGELADSVREVVSAAHRARHALVSGADDLSCARDLWGTVFTGTSGECSDIAASAERCRAELTQLHDLLRTTEETLRRYLDHLGASSAHGIEHPTSAQTASTPSSSHPPQSRSSPPPPGVKPGWSEREADNGNGIVYQAPNSVDNADMVRVMGPTAQYPYGYVRFYNTHGQPIGLNGKPGPRADTHIPRKPDGSYPTPDGWF